MGFFRLRFPGILQRFFGDFSKIFQGFFCNFRRFLRILGDSWGFLGILGDSCQFQARICPHRNHPDQSRVSAIPNDSQGFPRIPKDSFVIFLQSPGHSSILSASNIPTFHQISHKIPPPSSLCGFPPVSHRFPTGFPADSQRIPSGFPPVSQKRNSTDSSQL